MTKYGKLIFPLCSLYLIFLQPVFSQQDQDRSTKPELSLTGVVDVYYSYDFNQPETAYRQPFLYNHNRHNEFNLNLGLLRASVAHPKYRASLGLQAGTYPEDNYAAEQGMLQHVFEAFAGIALHPHVWLDAGIFGSHIGFESAITSENWTLSRSLLAENSPYFLSGAKITFTPNSNWTFAGLVTNGWQRIQRVPGSSLPGFGTQISYENEEGLVLNWSTFTGTDDPDPMRRVRVFNNLYVKVPLTSNFGLIAGVDVGNQQQSKGSQDYHWWYSPVVIARLELNSIWALAFRAEHYSDRNGVIVPFIHKQPFKTSGFSANVDYAPTPQIMWRIEGRWFQSPNQIFSSETDFSRNNFFMTSSLSVKIGN